MSIDKNTKEAYGTHTFTTAGSHDDLSCEDCGVNILAFYKDPRICTMRLKWKIKPSAFTDEHKTSSKLVQNLPQDNEALRDKIYNISLTPINDIYYVPPGVSGSIGLSPDRINQILELFQAEQTRLKADLIAKLRKSLPEKKEQDEGGYLTYATGANRVITELSAALDTLERGA